MQRKSFQFSATLIDANPQGFFNALKEALFTELSVVKKELAPQGVQDTLQLMNQLNELNYIKDKDISVSIATIAELISSAIEKLSPLEQKKLSALRQMVTEASVLLYYHHYGIQNFPDPKGSKLDANKPTQFDLSQGVPQHMINAMLADPQFCLVYVSGASANPYGHAIVFLGAAGFLHIDGITDFPKHMTIQEFNQYLNTHNKSVLGIQVIHAPHVNDMIVGVCDTIKSRYFWGAIKHNCIDFCHEVFKPGGYNAQKRTEYQSLSLSLPSEYLKKTPLDELRPDKKLMRDDRRNFSEAILINNDIRHLNILQDLLPDEVIKCVRYILLNPDKILASQKAILAQDAANASKSLSEQQLIVMAKQQIVDALSQLKKDVEDKYNVLFTSGRLQQVMELLSQRHIEEVFTGELFKLHGADPALARSSFTRASLNKANPKPPLAASENKASPLVQLNILAQQLTPKAEGSFKTEIDQLEEGLSPKKPQ